MNLKKIDNLTEEEIKALSPEQIKALIGLFNDLTSAVNEVFVVIETTMSDILDIFDPFIGRHEPDTPDDMPVITVDDSEDHDLFRNPCPQDPDGLHFYQGRYCVYCGASHPANQSNHR